MFAEVQADLVKALSGGTLSHLNEHTRALLATVSEDPAMLRKVAEVLAESKPSESKSSESKQDANKPSLAQPQAVQSAFPPAPPGHAAPLSPSFKLTRDQLRVLSVEQLKEYKAYLLAQKAASTSPTHSQPAAFASPPTVFASPPPMQQYGANFATPPGFHPRSPEHLARIGFMHAMSPGTVSAGFGPKVERRQRHGGDTAVIKGFANASQGSFMSSLRGGTEVKPVWRPGGNSRSASRGREQSVRSRTTAASRARAKASQRHKHASAHSPTGLERADQELVQQEQRLQAELARLGRSQRRAGRHLGAGPPQPRSAATWQAALGGDGDFEANNISTGEDSPQPERHQLAMSRPRPPQLHVASTAGTPLKLSAGAAPWSPKPVRGGAPSPRHMPPTTPGGSDDVFASNAPARGRRHSLAVLPGRGSNGYAAAPRSPVPRGATRRPSRLTKPKTKELVSPMGQMQRVALPDEQDAAARIQAIYRGKVARAQTHGMKAKAAQERDAQLAELKRIEKQEADLAAARIQASYRGKKARHTYQQHRTQQQHEQAQAAARIQAIYRGKVARAQTHGMKAKAAQERDAQLAELKRIEKQEADLAAARIQAVYRGKSVRAQSPKRSVERSAPAAQQPAEASSPGSASVFWVNGPAGPVAMELMPDGSVRAVPVPAGPGQADATYAAHAATVASAQAAAGSAPSGHFLPPRNAFAGSPAAQGGPTHGPAGGRGPADGPTSGGAPMVFAGEPDDDSTTDISVPRRAARGVHSSHDRPAALPQAPSNYEVSPPGKKAKKPKTAPAGGQLGSLMYVRNSQFDSMVAAGKEHSPDNPRFWVGRVMTIKPGGEVQLEWHRETSIGSGVYCPTRFPFVEQASLLRPFRTAVFDKPARGWQCFPTLESNDVDDATLDANDAAIKSEGPRASPHRPGGEDATKERLQWGELVSVGDFVFMKNARFTSDVDSDCDLPRYWVCRATGIHAPSGGNLPSVYVGRVPPDAGTAQAKAAEGASLRLQWFREQAPSCGLYVATGEFFSERPRVVRALSGGLSYRSREDIWVREGVKHGSRSDPTSPDYMPPPVLMFPGDEPLPRDVAKAQLSASAGSSGQKQWKVCSPAVPPLDGAQCPLHVGDFAFVPNVKFAPASASPQNPENWVVRVTGLALRNPPTTPQAQATIQWYMETEIGSRLYKATARSFPEIVSHLKPLYGMRQLPHNDGFMLGSDALDLAASFAEPTHASLSAASTEPPSALPQPGFSLSGAPVSPSAGHASRPQQAAHEAPSQVGSFIPPAPQQSPPPAPHAVASQQQQLQAPAPQREYQHAQQQAPTPPVQQQAPAPPVQQQAPAPPVQLTPQQAPPPPQMNSAPPPPAPVQPVGPPVNMQQQQPQQQSQVAEISDPQDDEYLMEPLPLYIKAMITGVSQLRVPAVDGASPDDPAGQMRPRQLYAVVKLAFTNPDTGKLKLRNTSAATTSSIHVVQPGATDRFQDCIWQWHIEDDPTQTSHKTATPNTLVAQVWACSMQQAPLLDPVQAGHVFCGSATLRVDMHDAVQQYVSHVSLPRPAQANPVLPPTLLALDNNLDDLFDRQFLTQPGQCRVASPPSPLATPSCTEIELPLRTQKDGPSVGFINVRSWVIIDKDVEEEDGTCAAATARR